jgi:teichuronic acid biosynthesis glycosyltransferase TuaC
VGAFPRTGRPTRPRVLVVTHLFPSAHAPMRGPWVAEQVDALRVHADVEVLCCTPGASESPYTRESGAYVTYANTSTLLGGGRIGLIGSTIRYASALRRHLKANDGRYDIIHAHFGFPDAFVAARAARHASIPLIVTLHGDDALRVAPRRDIIGRTVRYGIEAAQVVICVSEAMAEVVRPLFPNVDVRVAANGFDESLFRVVNAERDLGILFVGLLVPVKNVDLLLRAYARVRGQLDIPLTIAGDGVLRSELEALAAELGIADAVHFLGYRRRVEVASLMQRARVLALPSSSEGYPLVVTEALACGTPVVASRVGGIPDIIVSHRAGTLIPPGDVKSLAHALSEWATADVDPETVAASSGALPWSKMVLPIVQAYRDAAHIVS